MSTNPLFRRLLKNSGYLFSATGLSAVVGLIQGILITRLLGAAGYGVLGVVILFTSTLNNLISFRMSELVIKYIGQFHEAGDHRRAAALFKLAALVEMLASLLAYGLLLLLTPLAARYLVHDPALSSAFVLYGLVLLANLIAESATGLLQIGDRFRTIAIFNVLGNLVSLALIAIAFGLQAGLIAALGAYLIGKSISAVGLSLAALAEAARRWGRTWWRTPLALLADYQRELLRFAVSTNISASISLVTKDTELLWVSMLRSPAEAGFYRLALTVSNLVQMPVSPLPQATYPELSRQAARRDWPAFRDLLFKGALLAGGYTVLAGLFLTIAGRPLIAFFYTPEFLPAYPALLILLAGFLAANTFYWRRSALLALGRADYPVQVTGWLALFKLGATFLLVPRFGYLASAALLSGFYWLGSAFMVAKTYAIIAAAPPPAAGPADTPTPTAAPVGQSEEPLR